MLRYLRELLDFLDLFEFLEREDFWLSLGEDALSVGLENISQLNKYILNIQY